MYIISLIAFTSTIKFFKKSLVSDSFNFINRASIYLILEGCYAFGLLCIMIIIVIARVHTVNQQFHNLVNSSVNWFVGSSIFIIVFNLYVFNEIQFGPYSVMMVFILTVGMLFECILFSLFFRYILGNLVDFILR